ncbi:hypothetical protein A3A67_02545 [Candidatus Peribacteria bacterium RIFCSPLOWO2_01_FULL_51_18]|nr:MAG: hypothetical protein A3C52_00435 [Candidatus Peribacteria bacterium RIFCSPHIGHO2_02_FULL_51_15]OGJ66891.1 MAG: hypothetical protein A3A67_02545 [Candidatus Peribacteria bacterium RIFCSPLOWO2_01_FULL_51_18]
MKFFHNRSGFSLLEMILFLGILSIMFTTVISVFISTQETRVRQQGISEVEQRGAQILETLTKTIRRAEKVLAPAEGGSGSYIVLQMAANQEYPTIFSETASGELIFTQKNISSNLLHDRVNIQNLSFENTPNGSIVVSFDMVTTLSLVQRSQFSRQFRSSVTLFPDDFSVSGGCDSCPLPTCSDHLMRWHYCQENLCVLSENSVSC